MIDNDANGELEVQLTEVWIGSLPRMVSEPVCIPVSAWCASPLRKLLNFMSKAGGMVVEGWRLHGRFAKHVLWPMGSSCAVGMKSYALCILSGCGRGLAHERCKQCGERERGKYNG